MQWSDMYCTWYGYRMMILRCRGKTCIEQKFLSNPTLWGVIQINTRLQTTATKYGSAITMVSHKVVIQWFNLILLIHISVCLTGERHQNCTYFLQIFNQEIIFEKSFGLVLVPSDSIFEVKLKLLASIPRAPHWHSSLAAADVAVTWQLWRHSDVGIHRSLRRIAVIEFSQCRCL